MANCVDEPLLSAVDDVGEVTLHFSHLSKNLKALRGRGMMELFSLASLGAVQIMVGVFNIALGLGRMSYEPGDLTSLGAAYWLGAMFIVTGILSLLLAAWPSTCMLGFTVFMNIAGAIFAITGIVLYIIDLQNSSLLWMCDDLGLQGYNEDESCVNVAFLAQKLLTLMDATMVGMAALQLCANIILAFQGIMTLIYKWDKDEDAVKPLI